MLEHENKDAFMNILDCMTGTDGGIRFIRLRIMLERMQAEDTPTAEQVLDIMRKFSRLIDVANK
jgi:hypothetical protein